MKKGNKKYITKSETATGKNTKSVNKANNKATDNNELIKKAEQSKLPGYHVVKMKNGEKYLRSNPDKTKKNNLDPKRKI